MRKFAYMLFLGVIFSLLFSVAAFANIDLILDSENVDQKPFSDKSYVPIRLVVESLEAEEDWKEETATALIKQNDEKENCKSTESYGYSSGIKEVSNPGIDGVVTKAELEEIMGTKIKPESEYLIFPSLMDT